MRLTPTATLAVLGLALSAFAMEGQPKAKGQAQAEKIIADRDVFSAEFAAKVQGMLPNVASGLFKEFGFAVPADSAPEIAKIKKKYGKPEAVRESPRGPSGPGLPTPAVDTLYSYGMLRLGVPKGSATGKVEWLKIVSPE